MYNLNAPVENNILRRLDVRIKLLFGIEIIILLSIIENIELIILILIFPTAIYIYLNSIKSLINLLWGFKWYFLIFLGFGYLLTKALSLVQILVLILKFTGFFLAFASISKTTTPDEITDVMIKMKIPPSISWNVGTTLRQVYFIYSEIFMVRSIHELNSKIDKSRLEKISDFMTSVYANAIIRSKMFTKTLQARGFTRPHKEIITFQNSLNRIDIVALLIVCIPSVIYLIYGSQLFI